MTKYLYADYDTYITNLADPNDSWDRDDIDGTFIGVKVSHNTNHWYDLETELSGVAYAVYVTYTTGDTFGTDYRAKVLEVFPEEWQAAEFVAVARGEDGYSFEYKDKTYYRDWVGYFEHLDNLDYEAVVL